MKVKHGLMLTMVWAQVVMGTPPESKVPAGALPDAAAPLEAFGLTDRRVPPPPKDAVRSVFGGGRAADQFFASEVSLPALDHAALIAADDANQATTKRLRVGVSRDVAVDAALGQWQSIAGVGNVWTVAIESQDALGLRIRFADFHLPDGAFLQVWAPDAPDAINGPFTGEGPLGKGYFWSTVFTGQRVYVEYVAPAGHPGGGAVPFAIDTVSHHYRDYLADESAARGPGSCHNDSSCFVEWATRRNAVARMLFVDGLSSFVCTGQLLNTVAGDLTPYFLTANHCIGIQIDENPQSDPQDIAESLVATWLFQTSSCNGSIPSVASKPRSDFADFLARTRLDLDTPNLNLGSDASLLMIRGELPPGLAWTGWTGVDPPSLTASTGIHHPAGTYKRISLGTRGLPLGKFWEINWFDGPTEGGSSGSGIYRDDTQQLYGQLSHGVSACPLSPHPDFNWDRYGKFSDALDVFGPFLSEGTDDDLEDNDNCASAVNLPSGVYGQRVLKSGDEDWYRISVPSCADLEINASFIDDFGDIDLELFDACGGTLIAFAESSTDGEMIAIPSAGEPREYLLRAFLFSNTRNIYDLNVFMPSIAGAPAVTAFSASAGLPTIIPDSNTGGVSRSLSITEPGTILDLDVQLEISHTWNGDLIVELSKDGTSVTLIDRVGSLIFQPPFGFADAGFDIILDDASPQSIETSTSNGGLLSGTFSPQPGTLSSFAGLDQSGTWTLTVLDLAKGDTGALVTWGLIVSTSGESAPQCQRNDGISDFCRILDAPTDLGDYAYFATCFTGSGPAGLNSCCEVFDLDGDDDVDTADAELFVAEFGGQ